MLWSGKQVRHRKPEAASSEVETHLRARRALERGGESPEGAPDPRVRQRLARGGVRHSSEAETHPRGTATIRMVGRYGFFGPSAFPLWAVTTRSVFFGVHSVFICFLLFLQKRGFSAVIRGPLWLSPTVALEPLRWYPLGTRKGLRLLMGLSSLLTAVLFHGGTLAHPWV
jgi:hypothetical protein